MSLSVTMSLLDEAHTPVERAVAVPLAAELTDEPLWRRFLGQTAHLAIRGGARSVLREALGEPLGSLPRAWADSHVAEHGRPDFFMVRVATTRTASMDDARIRTIEAGHEIGRAAFTRDAQRVMAFVWGDDSQWPCSGPPGRTSALLQWRRSTGEFVGGTHVGQFREGNGTFDLSHDGRRVAVRSHRSTHVHEVDATTHLVSPRVLVELPGSEGPNVLTFLDDGRIVADDGYDVLVYSIDPEVHASRVSSIGNGGRVVALETAKVMIGGGSSPAPRIAVHELSTLALEGIAIADLGADEATPRILHQRWHDIVGTRRGAVVSALALSPSGTRLASGDWLRDVRVWDVERLAACAGSLRDTQVAAPRVASHDGWVSALAFVGDERLLSAGWDGVVLDIDLSAGPRMRRALHGHHGYVTSLDVSADGTEVLSADSSGSIISWDLTRGTSRAPPFLLDYGGHRPPIVLRVTSDQVRIAVGWIEAIFDHHGALLDTHAFEPPARASRSLGAHVEVRGFESDAIDVEVTALTRGEALDESGPAVGPALVVTRDDAVLDVVTLDASALAFAWVDAHTMVVLDAGGHVSFWRR
ncbi:WD40 repeat domain-containing protein [Paraliomyxa miuraensis]|uniref:WD40 repeat domain-containing protein n=1 Tax=Paraliomyxa miuraensis TaxID=376150 RepID=UPI002253404F|nr:WD40 repeat domain-containing protein [Paraliomyxa miuraensis]MCX4241826.1 hypothetical protein [Paraliomyxa miuraensis]